MNDLFPADKADKIADMFSFTDEEKGRFLDNVNGILKIHGIENSEKIVTAIYGYAELFASSKGNGYLPNISEHILGDVHVTKIEPPCGSNTYIVKTPKGFLTIDGGFPCYTNELKQTILSLYPNFFKQKTELLITHIDMDHMGAMDIFDRVYLNETGLENFRREAAGLGNFRVKNESRAPFYQMVVMLTDYKTPSLSNIKLLDTQKPDHSLPLSYIGELKAAGLTFAIYEGFGGHVEGSMIFLEKDVGLMFTGDILINPDGFTPEQLKRNRYPAILAGGSVNEDSKKAAAERNAAYEMMQERRWTVFPGHGDVFQL
ncbi:MAG TPA: MBL fold metallo-hydrolase [Methanocorpusculum sp.]|nr:MBL fold metallo-hydrolase [Methanocorpusculum sp.]